MQFISNSQDILFLVLAFCALWLTAFLVWFLYYGVMSVRQIYQAISQIKARIEAIDEVISLVREKLSGGFSYLSLIVAGVRKMVDLLGSNDETKKKKSKS